MKSKIFFSLAIALLFVVLILTFLTSGQVNAAPAFPATTRCVNTGGTGGCYSTIQAAINASSAGDIINVAAGTYNEKVTMKAGVSVYGDGMFSTKISRPNSANEAVVTFDTSGGTINNDTVLADLKIECTGTGSTGGSSKNHGIYISYASPRIVGVSVYNCYAAQGGGVFIDNGSPILEDISITHNYANEGGGLYSGGSPDLKIITKRPYYPYGSISSNHADTIGGGILTRYTTISMSDTTLWDNHAPEAAGAMFSLFGQINLYHNSISSNVAATGNGGGLTLTDVYNYKIIDNTLDGNTANYNGAGVSLERSGGIFYGNQFINNIAAGTGGAINIHDQNIVQVENNLFKNNHADIAGAIMAWYTNTVTIDANRIISNAALHTAGAIRINTRTPATVTNNIIARNKSWDGTSPSAVMFYKTPSLLINNTIADNLGSGFLFQQSTNCKIYNDIFSGNGYGIYNDGTSTYVYGDLDAYNNSGGNYKNVPVLPSTYSIDPKYTTTNITLPNYYHLKSDSWINDQGFPDVAPAYDIDGQIRSTFGTTSIGADEVVDQIYLPLVSR